jgi:hypothetical protein
MKTFKLATQISALLGTIACATASFAAVVDSGPLNIAVGQNADGIYYNVVTGAFSNALGATAPTGWDFNFYEVSAANGLTFFWPAQVGTNPRGGVAVGTVYSNLPVGTVINAASVLSQAAGGGGPTNFVNFITTGPKTLGISFNNEAGNTRHFGYVNMTTTAPLGFPVVITRVVFESTPETAITVAAPVAGSAFTGPAQNTAATPTQLTRALPATTSTSTLTFNVTGAAASLTCVATGAGYTVAPSPLALVVGTPGTVTVTHTGSAAGAFPGSVTCTGPAGSTGGPFTYFYNTTVTAQVLAPVRQLPSLNLLGMLGLIAGLGALGAFAVRRFR